MNKAFTMFLWKNEPSVNTPLSERMLNQVNNALNEVDNRVVSFDTTKANVTDLLTALSDVAFNEDTGEFTFTKKNGAKTVIDTKLEKLAVNFTYDSEKQRLVLTLEDGTIQYVDMKSLVSELEFLNSNTVIFTVSDGKVNAHIARGSITGDYLEPNYLANVELHASEALQSATNAKNSEDKANGSADLAQTYYQGAVDAVSEINKKLNIAEFTVDESGYLTYNDDAAYNFTVTDDGYLNWEVA